MVKYKIYEMLKTSIADRVDEYHTDKFLVEESTINDSGIGFDSFEEALNRIKNVGHNYTNYTILPYIYLT